MNANCYKAIDFFKRQDRLLLYKRLYREFLKAVSKDEQCIGDPIVSGHVKIKGRYLIRQVKHEHELQKILENYHMVRALTNEVQSGKIDRLIREAYGMSKEPEIEEMLHD